MGVNGPGDKTTSKVNRLGPIRLSHRGDLHHLALELFVGFL